MINLNKYKASWFIVGLFVFIVTSIFPPDIFSGKYVDNDKSNINPSSNVSVSAMAIENNINAKLKNGLSKPSIEQHIKRFNKQLTDLQAQIDLLKNEQVANTIDPTLPELTLEEESEMDTQAIQEEIDLMNSTLDSETVDSTWAEDAHVTLTEVLQNNERMAGVQLDAVECKSTLCRLSLSFDDQASLDNGFRTMPSIIPWEGQAFFRVDDMESGEAVVFLAREGHELPNTIN